MRVNFEKYQGTGNDFIMLNNLSGSYELLSIEEIRFLCDRKLGVGADGLIKISKHDAYDFEVEYFNADGTQSFCGNGARCSVVFAKSLGIIDSKTEFIAIDGTHKATVHKENVRLEMLPVDPAEIINEDFVLDTGSPHYIRIVNENSKENIIDFGKEIRFSDEFKHDGINVNLLTVLSEDTIDVRTYERGVEDETLSCGTGVTACALIYMMNTKKFPDAKVSVKTKGGILIVEAKSFSKESGFGDIWLSGPTQKVFDGSINL